MTTYVRIEYQPEQNKLLVADPATEVPDGHKVIAHTAHHITAAGYINEMQEVLPHRLPVYQYKVMFCNYLSFGEIE